MKIKAWLLGGALLMSAQAFAEQYWVPDNRPPRFCLQNFNAYGPVYAKGIEERTGRMTALLQGIPKCDVVHLQEVWNDSQINQIENDLKRQYSISAPNKEERIGVMSLFMGDVKGTETHAFAVNNEGGVLDSVREALNVRKAFHVVKSGFFGIDEDFYFINTHLHPTSEAVRLTQVMDLLRWRMKHQDLKMLLSGDFNANVDSVERGFVMATLATRDAMEDAMGGYPKKGYCTYCARNPLGWLFSDQVFDYIFYSNVGQSATTLQVLDGQVNMQGTPRRPLSDHYGVRVEFSVDPKTSETNALGLELRRSYALDNFAKAEKILAAAKEPEFKPYLEALRKMTEQLQTKSGAFWNYFSSFR
ncbi:endonuclease/exonuclease/phosphatase family protein [Bdellovibrio bacteriovorus]|nr:endonuclease/exonuclease/phosphatase family protein [Bdellovibrio bacteriovorus]